ncbi:MAG: hypothetical protein R2939_03865 [Kofleriaceae bacterium]
MACASDDGPSGPAPTLQVTSPERGTVRDHLGTIEVRGQVAPGEAGGAAVESVMVNGVPAALAADGSFTATIAARPGATLIETVATDTSGTVATDTRTMLAGTLITPDALIADAITAGISADTFDKMGVMAGNMIAATDVAALLAPMNPVLNAGAEEGEDCLWIKGDVEGFEVNQPRINLIPFSGGLRLEADFFDVYVPVDARYAFACVDARDHLNIRANRVSIAGDLAISAQNGGLKVDLTNADIDLDGLDLDATGVPGAVINLFQIESLVEWVFELGVERFMEPMVNDLMAGIGGVDLEMDLMGHTLDLSVVPGQIDFDPSGAQVRLDTRFFVQGTESSPGFIFTENSLPTMSTASGFEMAMADDAANQLLSGFWAAGALAISMPVDGGAFDETAVNAMLPPMLSADPDSGALRLIVGDLGLRFNQGGATQAEVALNLVMDVTVEPGEKFLELSLGEPEIHVDVVDGVANQTGFTDADLEAIIPLVVDHELHVLTPLIEAIPVPSIGGVSVVDLGIEGKNGYVTITGAMQ